MMKKRMKMGLTLDIEKAQDILNQVMAQPPSGIEIIPSNEGEQQLPSGTVDTIMADPIVVLSARSLHDNANTLHLSKLDENIYISNQKSAEHIDLLRSEGITHVVNLIAHKSKSMRIANNGPFEPLNTQSRIHECQEKQLKDMVQMSPEFLQLPSHHPRRNLMGEASKSHGILSQFGIGQQKSKQNADVPSKIKKQNDFSFNDGDLGISTQPILSEDSGIKYLKLAMRDQVDCDISMYMYATISFIEEALADSESNSKILVHCYKGNSRSAAVLAGYYMWKKGYTQQQALEFVRLKRGFIDPNIGFVGQLMALEQKLLWLNTLRNCEISQKQKLDQAIPSSTSGTSLSHHRTPQLYTFTLSKERIVARSINLSSSMEEFSSQQLKELLDRQGPLCLVQLEQCFLLMVSWAREYSESQVQKVKNGTQYLLKLAQLFCKYEQASSVCYIFREDYIIVDGKRQEQSSMIKITDLSQVELTYPTYEGSNNDQDPHIPTISKSTIANASLVPSL